MSESSEDYAEIVRGIVQEVVGNNSLEIAGSSRLQDDLELDSVDMFDIMAMLSERYDVDFRVDDFAEVETVEQFLSRLGELLAENK